LSTNRIVKFIAEIEEKRLQKDIRVKSTINKFSRLSGFNDKEKFVPESPDKLYIKWESNFLNGWSFSSINNIYGEPKRLMI
jgi:hypothetical protein